MIQDSWSCAHIWFSSVWKNNSSLLPLFSQPLPVFPVHHIPYITTTCYCTVSLAGKLPIRICHMSYKLYDLQWNKCWAEASGKKTSDGQLRFFMFENTSNWCTGCKDTNMYRLRQSKRCIQLTDTVSGLGHFMNECWVLKGWTFSFVKAACWLDSLPSVGKVFE